MEMKYWNRFMASGSVTDYLYYRGIAICGEVMERYGYGQDTGAKTGEFLSEPDNGNGNGLISHAHR